MFKMNKLAWGAAASAIALASAPAVYAQITSSTINGQVVDQNGNSVANATVTIQYGPTNQISTARTSENGVFVASGLRVGGPYTVTVRSADGSVLQEDIYLQPSSNSLTLNMQSTEGDDVITITGTRIGSRLDLNNGVGSVYDSQDILDQPSTSRDLIRTLNRDPLAAAGGEGNLSVAGSNPRFNGLAIDGALQQDDFGLSSSTYPSNRSPISLDAIESASLVASDYSVKASGFTGGLVNVITKSGTNEFKGSAYYYRRDEDYVGNTAFGRFNEVPAFDEEEYGFTLGGPIIKDKLFFFAAYDEFETASGINFTSQDENDGYDQRLFDDLNQIVLDTYGIDMGGRPQILNVPETSKRFLGKIDWNITDDHRASFTYQDTQETELTSISQTEFQSAWYQAPVDLKVYTGQLFSDWTDNFSTEIRANFKDYSRLQNCGNPEFGEIDIRLSEADLVGTPLEGYIDDGDGNVDTNDQFLTGSCDRFRHANIFEDERFQLYGAGNYILGDHFITVGAEYEKYELFNLFVPSASGEFIFRSYDDLINGTADLNYSNATSNDANDAATAWGISTYTMFAQDRWQMAQNFAVDYGVRVEFFSQDDEPADSPAFRDKYGFSSNQNLDGKTLVLPRVGFEYTPFDRTKLTGGFGVFAGGEPNVWISNAFQGLVASVSLDDLENVDPTQVPQVALDLVANTDQSELLPIDVIDPDFEIPSELKASLKLDQAFDADLNKFGVPLNLGENYQLSLQYLHTETQNGFLWTNLAQTELADTSPLGTAPDGRPIYADLDDLGIGDVTQLGNYEDGSSDIYTISLSNQFENGFGFNVAYAHQDVESVTPGTSSRGISNWRAITTQDLNNPGVGRAPFEIEHAFKVSAEYETNIFGELPSKFNLFGNIFSGEPISYTFDVNDSNALFGRASSLESSSDQSLLYVPEYGADGFNDPLVVFASGFQTDDFHAYAQERGLAGGQIQARGSDTGPWNSIWDFKYTQDLPFANFGYSRFDGNRLKFELDVENVGNLLNDEWGTFRSTDNNLNIIQADLVEASDVAANGVDGATALQGDAPRTTCLSTGDCVYRFRDFDDDPMAFDSASRSVYSVRIGLRYEW